MGLDPLSKFIKKNISISATALQFNIGNEWVPCHAYPRVASDDLWCEHSSCRLQFRNDRTLSTGQFVNIPLMHSNCNVCTSTSYECLTYSIQRLSSLRRLIKNVFLWLFIALPWLKID